MDVGCGKILAAMWGGVEDFGEEMRSTEPDFVADNQARTTFISVSFAEYFHFKAYSRQYLGIAKAHTHQNRCGQPQSNGTHGQTGLIAVGVPGGEYWLGLFPVCCVGQGRFEGWGRGIKTR